jgi:hypothetical protein
MAAILKFVVKSAVAGSLILVTLRVTHGPWRGAHHTTRIREGRNLMEQPSINSNQLNQEQEVPDKNITNPPPPSGVGAGHGHPWVSRGVKIH